MRLDTNAAFIVLVAVAVFLIWSASSIASARTRQARNREIQQIITGNVADRNVLDVPVASGDEAVGRIAYDLAGGDTRAECAPKCESGEHVVRFRYTFPDYVSGQHRTGIKTCFCERPAMDIAYLSGDTKLDAYAGGNGVTETAFMDELARKHAHQAFAIRS